MPTTHPATAVVTGASGMLGSATAVELARRGFDTLLVVRDRERGESLLRHVRQSGGTHRLVIGDLSEPTSVREVAAEVRSHVAGLTALVHAAAVLTAQRGTNSVGHETMFATNVLARFLLTHELAGPLQAGSGRVLFATGGSPDALSFDDLMAAGRWSAFAQFRATNAASHQLALELARRGAGVDISSNAFYPGPLQSDLMRQMPAPVRLLTAPFGRSAGKAASALVDLITEGAPTGTYYKLARRATPPKASRDTDSQRRLWNTAASLLGIDLADTIGGDR